MKKNTNDSLKHMAQALQRLSNLVFILFFLILALVVFVFYRIPDSTTTKKIIGPKADENGLFTEAARAALAEKIKDTTNYWQAPDTSSLKNLPNADEIRYGRNLIVNTANYFGANGSLVKNATNGMNCQNCHLDAGTKIWGNNYSAVMSTYPKYRARSGQTETVSKRVNDCFERSLNGRPIDSSGKEMRAIIAYLKFLGQGIEKGKRPAGSGLYELAFLNRAADVKLGREVYVLKCQVCHQKDGQGQINRQSMAFTYPPLWGERSYNDGAGLYRLSNFAKYVKFNMPQGADHLHPQLSDEEAWDVAAFVNSQPRPSYPRKNDWPNIAEKPIDYPFGPYNDEFTEEQHKFGPFEPIAAERAARK